MSEPNKVPVFVVPAGTWMPIVGETEAIDLLSPFRVVAERDYAKLAQALTLANQRAEAAEAERIEGFVCTYHEASALYARQEMTP